MNDFADLIEMHKRRPNQTPEDVEELETFRLLMMYAGRVGKNMKLSG